LGAERRVGVERFEDPLRLGRGDRVVQVLFDQFRLFRRHGYLDLRMQLWSSLRPRKRSELMALTLVRWRPAIAVTDSRSKYRALSTPMSRCGSFSKQRRRASTARPSSLDWSRATSSNTFSAALTLSFSSASPCWYWRRRCISILFRAMPLIQG